MVAVSGEALKWSQLNSMESVLGTVYGRENGPFLDDDCVIRIGVCGE